jgi:hypothetical protein
MFEPDDLLAAARTAVLESSDRQVSTADDAMEKNRLECVPTERMEGTRWSPGTPALLAALAFFSPLPFLTRPCPSYIAAETAEGEAVHRLEQKEVAGLSSLRRLRRYQNGDGNEQYKPRKLKPIKGNKLLRHKTFSADGMTVQRLKNCDCAGCLLLSRGHP